MIRSLISGFNANKGILLTWTQRTSSFGTTAIVGVTYGNSLFVAVGVNGKLATSPDGITWTQRTSSFGTSNIYGVTYANNLFVAVGVNGKLATSPDGITWTQRTSSFGTIAINAVTYGNGLFVAVGDSGKLATSPDGITWTQRTTNWNTSYAITNIAYGDGLFIIAGTRTLLDSYTVKISSDGITWTNETKAESFSPATFTELTFFDGYFIGTSSSYYYKRVTNWALISKDITANGFSSGTQLLVAVGTNGRISVCKNDFAWYRQNTAISTTLFAVTCGNGLFVAVGNSGVILTATESWEE